MLYLMVTLGIESSCDETAAAVVKDGYYLKSSVVASSIDLHQKYGGVVPEIAARSHIEVILPVITEALEKANCTWQDIDGISVTYGAGLGGSLLIGVLTARTLALVFNKPLVKINHVEAHLYANFLTKTDETSYVLPREQPDFPFIGVIVSGGHTQLVLFRDHSDYALLGKTLDDAVGEAFDKVSKILGLPYPGGPSVSKIAEQGSSGAIKLPKPSMPGYDFSYSGLKTAVLRQAQAEIGENYTFPSIKLSERLKMAQKANIAYAFESTAIDMILDKLKAAVNEYGPSCIVVAGGVAANKYLRSQLKTRFDIPVFIPDPNLCTDNAAMVATLGYFKIGASKDIADPYTLEIAPSLSM